MSYSLSVQSSVLSALGSDLGIVVSQLHYWLSQTKYEWGTVRNGKRYIFNTLEQWQEQFNWLTRSKLYRVFKELRDRGIVLFEQFDKSKYNRRGYYSLDYEKLAELDIDLLKPLETSTFHQRNIDVSSAERLYIDPNNTFKEIQAKHECLLEKEIEREGGKEQEEDKSRLVAAVAAATQMGDRIPRREILATESPSNSFSVNQENISKRKTTSPRVEQKINNSQWRLHLDKLDELGLKLNQNIENLVKSYSSKDVELAIALFIERRRQGTLVKPEGYFVQTLKEGWGKEQPIAQEENSKEVFATWYGMLRLLGDVCGQEVREGEQWVNANGYWERFEDMWERGYTLDFVRKRYQRSKNGS